MTSSLLYCQLDLLLGYHVPPSIHDESDEWNPFESPQIIKNIIRGKSPNAEHHPLMGEDANEDDTE